MYANFGCSNGPASESRLINTKCFFTWEQENIHSSENRKFEEHTNVQMYFQDLVYQLFKYFVHKYQLK